jgi:hypothetical protein
MFGLQNRKEIYPFFLCELQRSLVRALGVSDRDAMGGDRYFDAIFVAAAAVAALAPDECWALIHVVPA